ncbi:MAG TPA: M12 family metallo-peptidase [Actinophytocola sp.]|uniref:M12 family metallo-peptidase n=1 Tax=Actinophytocola sp. TaxID=1872138 RepID=UPI002DBA5E43|nr:M12 family metallo-peptidase [Actinophytocola sp.]HEU5474253.1 M12 family metallo-peptidase [Actinophytocola sp.]
MNAPLGWCVGPEESELAMSAFPRSVRRWATRGPAAAVVALLTLTFLTPVAGPAAAAPDPTNPWTKVDNPAVASRSARPADVRTTRFAGYTLDRSAMAVGLDRVSRAPSAVMTLPTPAGELQRFALVESPVMEPGLAAAHPEIRTYAGKGIDDPTATVRADLTPLGFHASVRSTSGVWYIDPYFHRDQSLYASYYGHDVANPQGPLVEHEEVEQLVQDLAPVLTEPVVRLRTYRLALVTDPSYATFFGAENVTAAKVTLVNRVNQIYEDETAIRLVLINDTDRTNLNTAAMATEPNGPCGAAACYTPAQLAGCAGSTLTRNGIVLGQLVGASNYDVGHIGLGVDGGGVAGLGVVGGANKARGCTGLPTPVGDFYAVDYVAHEIGHQFAGNHTFNGTQLNCSGGNRSAANSYEPGSGSSIMAYAGICRQDDLQPHSDPYWSQRSYTEITTFINSTRPAINEVQTVSLREFDTDGDSFALTFGGAQSAPIVRGVNYTAAGIKAAIEGIAGWPAGAEVTVAGFGGGAAFNDAGFQVTFGTGALAATNVESLGLTATSGAAGFVGETVKGGAVDNGGVTVEDTDNHAPVVTTPASFTIPTRTPFTLSGSATDSDGDALTYLWEQNDRGGATGTALTSNTKTNGPLFRQFGTAAIVSPEDTLEYYSPGENAVNGDPTRVFPDLAQIAAGHTNAATGLCPPAPPPPTSGGSNVPGEIRDCYSEFLPTADWVGIDNSRTLHFRLTARDGNLGAGGVGSSDTALVIAPEAGPFLVTSQSSAETVRGGSAQPVSWSVAGTDAAPIGVTEVRISLSLDGGATYPHVLAERTANDGSESVTLPDVATTKGRIKVEAVGNVFFDLSDADLTIQASPRVSNDAPSGTATVQYSDALSPALTIGASDPDSAGTTLSAVATGLPAGLELVLAATSGDDARPGLRTWTVAGTTTAPPGDYPVTVAVTDDVGIVGSTAFLIRVTPENAEATYTGDSLTEARDSGTVLLRATVRDSSVLPGATDTTPGDIRTATVSFVAAGRTLCTAPIGLLGTPTTDASASCTATLPQGVHQVSPLITGNYTATTTSPVEIFRPHNSIVIAGTTLTASQSSGAFPADPGTRIDTTLLISHTRSHNTTTGLATAQFQSAGHRYQLLATDFATFGAKPTNRQLHLNLRATAKLLDITNPHRPTVVATNLTLHLSATDTTHDTLALTLYQGARLILSTNWTGATTTQLPLTTGNILII